VPHLHFKLVVLPPLVNATSLPFALAQSVIAFTAEAPALLLSHVFSAVTTLHLESEPQHAHSLNVPSEFEFKLLSAAHSVYGFLLIHICVGEISRPPHRHALNGLSVGLLPVADGQSAIAATVLSEALLLKPHVSASLPSPFVD
jgi:hypothetical protein